jgi:phage major head subunit gpT-like protein
MGTEYDLISRDAQRALEEFSEEFSAALVQPTREQWARELGLYRASRALKTTFPIPISAAGYEELKGDIRYRALAEKSLELVPKTWQDGVEELASVIEAPDFIGWTGQPEAMAAAASSLMNEIIAGLLEANPVLAFDGQQLFSGTHPINVFDLAAGTFDNDIDAAIDGTGMGLIKTHFRSLKAPNGKPLGLRATHLLVPPALEEEAKTLLEQDMIIQSLDGGTTFGAVDNRHKGTVTLIVADELEDDEEFYALALNKPGMYPWVTQDEGAPEELISDKSSDHYKRTLKVAIAYVLRGNGAIALPHPIVRCSGSNPTP